MCNVSEVAIPRISVHHFAGSNVVEINYKIIILNVDIIPSMVHNALQCNIIMQNTTIR